MPSAADYQSVDMVTKRGARFHRTNHGVSGCNFGQSRQQMKPLHVDAILISKEVKPGPADC